MARGAGAAGTRGSRRACGCATSHGAVPCAVVWPCCCTVACAATGARSVLYFDKWMGCRSCTGAGVHACCDARAPVGCSAAALAGAIGNPTPVRPLRVTKRHDQAASTPECGQCFARLPFYARPEGCLPQSARHVSLVSWLQTSLSSAWSCLQRTLRLFAVCCLLSWMSRAVATVACALLGALLCCVSRCCRFPRPLTALLCPCAQSCCSALALDGAVAVVVLHPPLVVAAFQLTHTCASPEAAAAALSRASCVVCVCVCVFVPLCGCCVPVYRLKKPLQDPPR